MAVPQDMLLAMAKPQPPTSGLSPAQEERQAELRQNLDSLKTQIKKIKEEKKAVAAKKEELEEQEVALKAELKQLNTAFKDVVKRLKNIPNA